MNKLITFLVLSTTATSAFAAPATNSIPEPGMLPLLGLGVLALALAKRFKK